MTVLPPLKRRRLSPPTSSDGQSPPLTPIAPQDLSRQNDHLTQAAGWDLEQDYEQRPRRRKNDVEIQRLPIKLRDGRVEHLGALQASSTDEDSLLGTADEEDREEQASVEDKSITGTPREQLLEAKEELARLAGLLSEDPEGHTSGFRRLAEIATSSNPTVKKLALATQLAVYKDVIPGYRIRAHGESDGAEKLSKEVRRLRSFEQALVGSYQTYVKELAIHAKNSGEDRHEDLAGIASVAISCACTLLVHVPHFNFRGELLEILVNKLSGKTVDKDYAKCLETLETLFRDDEDGKPSLEGVTQLTKMIKSREYHIDESLLNVFLHLRLLSELSLRGSHTRTDRNHENDASIGRKLKVKREFRTKKLRKMLKERKAVEKEFEVADAIVSHEERDRLQAETLKMVFITYFRILKARTPNLMGAVLEGLAKYAHLINQDFFGDLLETLKDLMSNSQAESVYDQEDVNSADRIEQFSLPSSKDSIREALLSISTAFALLSGQDVARSAPSLSIDLTFFTTHVYRLLYTMSTHPDIELGSKSLRLADPHSIHSSLSPTKNNKINLQTPSALLFKILNAILLERSVPPLRIAAFVKQLYTCSLQLPEKSAQAMLKLVDQVIKIHCKKILALWNTEETKGDGVFDALRKDLEGSNPFASTVWEGELLRCHYVPRVREQARAIETFLEKKLV